jgi:hypothetical protein
MFPHGRMAQSAPVTKGKLFYWANVPTENIKNISQRSESWALRSTRTDIVIVVDELIDELVLGRSHELTAVSWLSSWQILPFGFRDRL